MTRAGTNDYHGALREGHHQYSWNALDFFTKQTYYNRIAAASYSSRFIGCVTWMRNGT